MKKTFLTVMFIGYLSTPLFALAQRTGGGDLIFTPSNVHPVVFSHYKHLKEAGLKCSSCHYRFFQMAHGSRKMDMGKITKGRFCGRCHNGQVSFDVQDPKNCPLCHQESSSSLSIEQQ